MSAALRPFFVFKPFSIDTSLALVTPSLDRVMHPRLHVHPRKRRRNKAAAVASVSSKPTLLRKLLAPQLHRESSIALQAVRFIVQSRFFLEDGSSADGEVDGAAAAPQSAPATTASPLAPPTSTAAAGPEPVEASGKTPSVSAPASPRVAAVAAAACAPPVDDKAGAASPTTAAEESSAMQ